MTSSLAAGKTASIAISTNTAATPCWARNDVTVGAYRRSVNGADRSIVPTELTEITRATYEPAGARAPLDVVPSHDSVCVPVSSEAAGSVTTTVPSAVSTRSVTLAGRDSVNVALTPPTDELG